jgi:ubiquinone biosynthesis protein COQ9
MSDNLEIKDKIINDALKNINFDGWTKETILTGFVSNKINVDDYEILFPNGIIDTIIHFADLSDRLMIKEFKETDYTDLRTPDKIKQLLLCRFRVLNPNKEAVRKSIACLALPKNSKFALKALYKTTDEIWRTVGDRSTDISFYTKRGILAGVYSTTKMSWLGSHDPDLSKVEEFIERRLKNVKLLGSITKPIKENLNKPFNIFNNFPFFNFNR